MQWIKRFILHFRHIKSLVIIRVLLVIVFLWGVKITAPSFKNGAVGQFQCFQKQTLFILWHTVPLERCILHKHNDAQNICIYDNPTPNGRLHCRTGFTQTSGGWTIEKKDEEPWCFCPIVCSKVPVKRSYGNKNNVEAVPKVGSKDLHCKPFLDETLSWIAD